MCKQGLGFWSPSLPARVGDTYDISFFVRGMELKPTGAAAIAAFVGIHRRHRPARAGSGVTHRHRRGQAADWHIRLDQLAAEVKVPDGAKRMRVFIGLLPALGQCCWTTYPLKSGDRMYRGSVTTRRIPPTSKAEHAARRRSRRK